MRIKRFTPLVLCLVMAASTAVRANAGEMEISVLYPYPSVIYKSVNVTGNLQVAQDVLWPAATQSIVYVQGTWNVKNNLVAGGVGGRLYADGLTASMAAPFANNFGVIFLPAHAYETTQTTHNFAAEQDATLVWGVIRNSTTHGLVKTMLTVVGTVEANVLAADSIYTETFTEINCASTDFNEKRNGIAGITGTAGVDLRHIRLYMDADPMLFNPTGGQVIVNGDALPAEPTTALIIGRSGDGTAGYASAWNVIASSRVYKTDIQPLGPAGYAGILKGLSDTDIVTFEYKNDSTHRGRIGFIAETAPREIVNNSRNAVSVTDEVGFLLAAAKGVQNEQAEIAERLSRLERRRGES